MPHLHDHVDFTAEVFIVYQGKVLLRKHDKYKVWLSVGGHIELDEDPNQAAIREVKEEVGLEVQLIGAPITTPDHGQAGYQDLIPPRFLYRHPISETHTHVVMVYFARTDQADTTNQGAEQSEAMHWFSAEDLNDPQYDLQPSIRLHAQTALREVLVT